MAFPAGYLSHRLFWNDLDFKPGMAHFLDYLILIVGLALDFKGADR